MTHTTESMVTQAALEPCPFCRGQAEWASRKPYLVHCANPDCLGHHYEQDEQGGYNHSFYTEAEAVAAWNTRTAAQPERETVDAVEAFEMGRLWQQMLRGQTLEDSRAIGRTLDNDIFKSIHARLAAAEKEIGFNPFADSDTGIFQAIKIIHAALTTPAPAVSRDEIVELAGVVAALPCETKGAEDLEPGCCRTCRARATLTAIDAHLAGEPGQGDDARAIAALRSRDAGADAMPSDLLTEFGKHVGWELSYAGWDDEAEWQVHQVNGGRNDREWTLIGTGQTPAAAIRAALSETRP